MSLEILVLVTLLIVTIWNIWQFFNILRRKAPHLFHLGDIESVVVLSDIHILDSIDERPNLIRLLSKIKPSIMIIAGDLFEREHRRMDRNSLRGILLRTLKSISWIREIIYITSLTSHDPILHTDVICMEMPGDVTTRITVLKGGLVHFRSNNTDFYVLHGDFLCRNGAYAGLINLLATTLFRRKLFLESLGKKFLKLDENSWLIMGHTHMVGIDAKRRLINCGCWKSYWRAKATGTLVHIYKGTPNLIHVSI